jgi:hypothetical protein
MQVQSAEKPTVKIQKIDILTLLWCLGGFAEEEYYHLGHGKLWTEADHDVLRKFWGKRSVPEIAKILDRNPRTIYVHVHHLRRREGIEKWPIKIRLSEFS